MGASLKNNAPHQQHTGDLGDQAMSEYKTVVKNNIIYGLLVLAPLAFVVVLLAKLLEIIKDLAHALGLQTWAGVGLVLVLGLGVLFCACFLIGSALRTKIGAWSFERFEQKVLRQIPGYEIIANLLKGFAEKRTAYPAAMVRLHGQDSAVLGFVMEENPGGWLTVFVPLAPLMTMGNVHLVRPELVTILEGASLDLTNCISQWGMGSSKVLEKLPGQSD